MSYEIAFLIAALFLMALVVLLLAVLASAVSQIGVLILEDAKVQRHSARLLDSIDTKVGS
jgi:hypothetical protein